jgi:hypothetical protein
LGEDSAILRYCLDELTTQSKTLYCPLGWLAIVELEGEANRAPTFRSRLAEGKPTASDCYEPGHARLPCRVLWRLVVNFKHE